MATHTAHGGEMEREERIWAVALEHYMYKCILTTLKLLDGKRFLSVFVCVVNFFEANKEQEHHSQWIWDADR